MVPILRICALAILLPFTPALAQTDEVTSAQSDVVLNGQQFGAWTVNCVAVAVGQTNCLLTQRILRSSDGAFIADVITTENSDGGTFLIARVPLGVFLPGGFAMREAESEDREDLLQFDWQLCNTEVCEALLAVDAETVETLSAEDNSMIAAFRPNAQSEPFLFQLSLNGMTDGLNALRSK